jgi:hypothetical protein
LTRLFAGSFFASYSGYGFRLMKSGAAEFDGADDIKRTSFCNKPLKHGL